MRNTKPILVHEFQTIRVGEKYPLDINGERVFEQHHFDALAKYFTQYKPPFYSLGYNRIYFNQYVGVIKVGDLSIEVLPKTDRHQLAKPQWQSLLLEMLLISLQVEAKSTTQANIHIRQHSVLETYLSLFLIEAEVLIHRGLVKKYRTHVSNQSALKGKLLVHHQITKNAVHAERFYVAHQVYDRDNVFNAIIRQALECIATIGTMTLSREAQALLLYFPDCNPVAINEKLFHRMSYDRKTASYKRAVELARIILLNYHPDLRGGTNDILAIMFDMNLLWESFITWSLRKAAHTYNVKIRAQNKTLFWRHEDNWNLCLKPDIVVEGISGSLVIDTKWKYEKGVSMEDVRQLYAYLDYFNSKEGYLLYPAKLEGLAVDSKEGQFYNPLDHKQMTDKQCGLLFADLISKKPLRDHSLLNRDIGEEILILLMDM